MEVTRYNFQRLLPSLLAAIAGAHFVAFDLELSGIPTATQDRHAVPRQDSRDTKPSLQQRYDEGKKAAEMYQVLQFGITCVEENAERAVTFLLSHNFRMESPFLEGVSYLSRDEEITARRIALQQSEKTAIIDIQLRADDEESVEFLQRVRGEVDAWLKQNNSHDFVNISSNENSDSNSQDRGLTNFQKRLVHQVIRAEYPDLVTTSRPGFIQVRRFDKQREDSLQVSRNKRFEERLARSIGLRWLVDAMGDGDLTAIEPENVIQGTDVKPLEEEIFRFIEVRKRLRSQRSVLVGHNVFLDLINFYACFFGQLPDRVEDFLSVMHNIFPLIIDTKYLATQGKANAELARSSLEDLWLEVSEVEAPVIELHPEHLEYERANLPHVAGFDSFLTAKVVIRLSAKLEKAGYYVDENDKPIKKDEIPHRSLKRKVPEREKELLDVSNQTQSKGKDSEGKSKKDSSTSPATASSRFSHPTKFDLLGDIPSDEDPTPLSLLPHSSADRESLPRKKEKQVSNTATLMPPFNSAFWNTYGNKLRVNGTIEQFCSLS
ncbi:MAG: hypothetical protein Q9167_002659 [Letrouitia subvulpina]